MPEVGCMQASKATGKQGSKGERRRALSVSLAQPFTPQFVSGPSHGHMYSDRILQRFTFHSMASPSYMGTYIYSCEHAL